MKQPLRFSLLILSVFCANFTKVCYSQIPAYLPKDSLVGWWPFNGNAQDESGSGNHGIVNGATLVNNRFGKASSAYSFNGNYIDIDNKFFDNGWNAYTVSIWMNSATYSNNGESQMLLNSIPHDGWAITWNAQGQKQMACGVNSDPLYHNWDVISGVYWGSQGILTSKWYHIVFVKKANTYKCFVDGKLVKIINGKKTPISSFIGMRIGNIAPGWSSEPFIGSLDDIAIWNRELSETEISVLSNACQQQITKQPENLEMYSGTAKFICKSSDTLSTFQWQSNAGLGWVSLSNAGQYSGSNKDTLLVNNVSSLNNNQLFRCLVKGECAVDTSQIASLKIWGVAQSNFKVKTIKIMPNPAFDYLKMQFYGVGFTIKVYDVSGKKIYSNTFKSKEATLNIKDWYSGIYSFAVFNEYNQMLAIEKIIKY